jgi:hypothetical protein
MRPDTAIAYRTARVPIAIVPFAYHGSMPRIRASVFLGSSLLFACVSSADDPMCSGWQVKPRAAVAADQEVTLAPGGPRILSTATQIPASGYPIDIAWLPDSFGVANSLIYTDQRIYDECHEVSGVFQRCRGVGLVAATEGAPPPSAVPISGVENDNFHGLVALPTCKLIVSSLGHAHALGVYSVEGDKLVGLGAVKIPGVPAGIAATENADALWVTDFGGEGGTASHLRRLTANGGGAICTALADSAQHPSTPTVSVTQDIQLDEAGYYSIALGAGSIVASQLRGRNVVVVHTKDLVCGESATCAASPVDCAKREPVGDPAPCTYYDVGAHPQGIAVSGAHAVVAVSDDDALVSVPLRRFSAPGTTVPDRRTIPDTNRCKLTDGLPGLSPSALVVAGRQDGSETVFVALAAADSVARVALGGDLDDGEASCSGGTLARYHVGEYPTSLALSADGKKLAVANAKGLGRLLPTQHSVVPPDGGAAYPASEFHAEDHPGSLTVLSLDTPPDTMAEDPPQTDFSPNDCKGAFPVPLTPGGPTPLKHVVLIVRENKTFDVLLGSRDGSPQLEFDATRVRQGKGKITRYLHDLADQFAVNATFFANSEVSSQGHSWLTSAYINDYEERMHLEESRLDFISTEPGLEPASPAFGTFFEHLLRWQVDFRIFGELAGATGTWGDDTVLNHVDLQYPGVGFTLDRTDVERVEHLRRALDGRPLPAFTYVLLPRDHTFGTCLGKPTPEGMIRENDAATAQFIKYLAERDDWNETAAFLVEDDPQTGADSVDYHRTLLLAASPWSKQGALSHQRGDFVSLLATIERILHVGPMNKLDERAVPLFDMFEGRMHTAALPPVSNDDLAPPPVVTKDEYPMAVDCDGGGFAGPDLMSMTGTFVEWSTFQRVPPRLAMMGVDGPHVAQLIWSEAERRAWPGVERHLSAMRRLRAFAAARGLSLPPELALPR